MKWGTILVLGFFLGVIVLHPSLGRAELEEEASQGYFEAGVAYLDQGEYEKAIRPSEKSFGIIP